MRLYEDYKEDENPEKHLRQYYSKEAIKEAFLKMNVDIWQNYENFKTQLQNKGLEQVSEDLADELIKLMN